jgi:hypothetical protein
VKALPEGINISILQSPLAELEHPFAIVQKC